MLTLVAWGAVTDRHGERFVLLTGLVATTAAGALAALGGGTPLLALALVLAGAAAASTNSASGRVVVGWFPPAAPRAGHGDPADGAAGRASGVAAVSIAGRRRPARRARRAVGPDRSPAPSPPSWSSRSSWSTRPAPSAAAGRPPNPYRRDRFLARVHGVSVLLVVPQFLVWTFALVWLVQDRGWSPAAAGSLVAVAQLAGALGRIAAGHLSDVVGSRMRPLRWVALAAAADDGAARAGRRAATGRSRSRCWWWPRCSPSPTTGWPSPPSPSGPGRSGRAAPSACRTPRSS